MRASADLSHPNRPTVPRLGEALEFLRLIWALDHALQRTSKRMEADLGVTGPQRLVIRIVGRFPGILASHLAEILHIHPSTVTGVLHRLERQGLITRQPDPRDRRRAFLGLTAKGRNIDGTREGTIEAAVKATLSCLPSETIQGAREVLTRLAASLEQRSPPGDPRSVKIEVLPRRLRRKSASPTRKSYPR